MKYAEVGKVAAGGGEELATACTQQKENKRGNSRHSRNVFKSIKASVGTGYLLPLEESIKEHGLATLDKTAISLLYVFINRPPKNRCGARWN